MLLGTASRSGPNVNPSRGGISAIAADLHRLTSSVDVRRPGDAPALLRAVLSAVTDVAVAHRAVIEHPTPADMILLFGFPRTRKDDAARAVRTALDVQRALLTIRNRWVREERHEAQSAALGIGIASEEPDVAGAVTPGRAAANLVASRASRLGRTAGALEVFADTTTRSRAEEYVAGEVDWTEADAPDGEGGTIRVFRCARRQAHLYAVARSLALDPVCWVRVEPARSVRRRVGGRTLHFCSAACAQKFADDPESFLV